MHSLAIQANERLPERILGLLSSKGAQIYFPKAGILGQSAAARGRRINGTMGIALDESGRPMHLRGLNDPVSLDPVDVFPYASSYGKPALRRRWLEMLHEKNPDLAEIPITTPVVTNALTHGLSVAASLCLDPGDRLILPDRYWGNYGLVFSHGYGAVLATYPTFSASGFNVQGLRDALYDGPPGKRVVLLNFPNNPTGYTCTVAEAEQIRDTLTQAADDGYDVVALIDDAYFGLVYESGVMTQSIFTYLANAHPGLLAIKIDGATKEDFAWGYRVGFVTLGFQGADEAALTALEDKVAGTVRGSISNASHLSQSLILAAYESAEYTTWKSETYDALKARYDAVRAVFEAHPEYAESFEPQPFNSGYFLCVRPKRGDAEQIRRALLEDFDTGVIATGGLIRVAYSSVPCALIPELFANVHAVIQRTP